MDERAEQIERDVESVAEVVTMMTGELMHGPRKMDPATVAGGLTRALAHLLILNYGASEGAAWLRTQANAIGALEPNH